MHALHPTIPKLLFEGPAHKFEPLTVEPRARPVPVADPDHRRRIVSQRAESIFACTEHYLRILARKRDGEYLSDMAQTVEDLIGPLLLKACRSKGNCSHYSPADPKGNRDLGFDAVAFHGFAFNGIRYLLYGGEAREFPVEYFCDCPRKLLSG